MPVTDQTAVHEALASAPCAPQGQCNCGPNCQCGDDCRCSTAGDCTSHQA